MHFAIALLVTLAASPSAPRPAEPVRLDATAADTLRTAIEKDRKETLDWLKGEPTSYLATILRRDFEERASMVVGSGPEADVRIADPEIKPRHLRVTVEGDSFRVEALDEGATFKVRDQVMGQAKLGPSSIGIGRYTVRLSHQRFPALIVFDPQSPRFKAYKGIPYFPVDLGYRFVLPLTPNPEPDTVIILSTRGNQRRAIRAGWFDFKLGGKACRLEATRLLEPGVGERDLGLFFRDKTSGKQSYGLGRYVNLEPKDDGTYVLDFNGAYSPACAYSEHYNCPIPPKANQLTVAIKVGEMNPHYLDH